MITTHGFIAPSISLLLLTLGTRAGRAQTPDAPQPGVSVQTEVRLVSRYVWRGYDLSKSKPAMQPYAEFGLPNGVGFNAFATTAIDGTTEVDEGQLGITYTRGFGSALEGSAGYLEYLMPGTETEPSADPDDVQAFSSAGEFFLGITRNWERGSVAITYSRGVGTGEGNSLTLWAQRTFSWAGERWAAEPYLQVDYLDQYGAPRSFADRVAAVEVALPLVRQIGGVQVGVGGYLTWVPSGYVREANGAAGAGSRALLPWIAVTILAGRD